MKIVRYVLAVLVGFLLGGIVNVTILKIGGYLIPLPDGVDPNNLESVVAAMPRFESRHFLSPFLAHAVGTFVSALVAALIATRHKSVFAMAMGTIGLVGGVAAVFMIPAPPWFDAADLLLAYLPTAWIGGRVAAFLSAPKSEA